MISPIVTNRRKGDKKKSQFSVRFLAIAICILAGILILQVIILVRKVSSNGETGIDTDENFATTVTSCGFIKG